MKTLIAVLIILTVSFAATVVIAESYVVQVVAQFDGQTLERIVLVDGSDVPLQAAPEDVVVVDAPKQGRCWAGDCRIHVDELIVQLCDVFCNYPLHCYEGNFVPTCENGECWNTSKLICNFDPKKLGR
jgi:hypothetical protein